MKYALITLPLRVSTKSNQRGHWAKHSKATKLERLLTCAAVNNAGLVRTPTERVVAVFTRYAPRTLDRWDNLPNAFKGCIDGLAESFGIDDRSPLYEFSFRQVKAKDYWITIEIEVKKAL